MVKQERLAVSAAEAEALLHSITTSTATAEKEKQVVTGIVEQVSSKAAVRSSAVATHQTNSIGVVEK